jgi:hypothetical protein
MNRGWVRRTAELHDELTAIAGGDPRWWLLAGGTALAEPWPARPGYLASDAEPATDTFIGHRTTTALEPSRDPLRDAIDRARAARAALRELDGTLPEQPLAVTLVRGDRAVTEPSALDAAAFAIGSRCLIAALDDPTLLHQLAAVARGAEPAPWYGPTPFVCVSIGDDPIETARHGHRRAWRNGRGPWLGLGRTGELATVSTCHMVVDGYGHACLTGRIHAIADARTERLARGLAPHATRHAAHPAPLPSLAPVAGAVPLGVAWHELDGDSPRALPLAHAIGQILHRAAGRPDARFSPTLQIPVAPGRLDDPERRRRRAMPAVVSVRFDRGAPEPYATFEARARTALAREIDGVGLCARLIAAARATPAPLAWKRRSFSTSRPRWLDRISDVLGGRACVSRIRIDAPIPASCAVSSPSRDASAVDPLGACVITVVDDGTRAAITLCGSGLVGSEVAARAVLQELLTLARASDQPSRAPLVRRNDHL